MPWYAVTPGFPIDVHDSVPFDSALHSFLANNFNADHFYQVPITRRWGIHLAKILFDHGK
jgi:hypothetical protein